MATLSENQKTLRADETYALISADKVEGTEVFSRDGKHLGEVEKIMIDKVSGKVAYAVISFGGFLGMGKTRRALPWDVLHYDTDRAGYVIDLDEATLRATPELSGDEDLDDAEWRERLSRHFGMTE